MIYKLKENKKEILDFLKRIILLSVLFVPAFIVFGFFGIVLYILPFDIIEAYFIDVVQHNFLEDIILILGIANFVSAYCILKAFGFFKKTDNMKFFLALPIIIFVGLISELCYDYLYLRHAYIEIFGIYVINIILAFLLHRFFNFLTKKFPKHLTKIKYYSSIEFWKELFKKAIENKKEVFLNILRIALFCTLYAFLTPYICKHFSLENQNISLLVFFGFFIYSYLGLKLFGFFKKTDNLKFYQAYLVLLVLSIIVRRWLSYTFYYADLYHILLMRCFLLSFVFHRLFNFLWNKFSISDK